ncbi:MAG: RluA family pseudouridine synthase [Acidimicrobiales bacterium]|nr:RluA family pseudouridine synthase [Acidimicrobiales bacterium]
MSAAVGTETEIVAALDGERVDRVVAMLTGLSRKACAVLVEEGKVAVDDVVVTSRSLRLQTGQRLAVAWVEVPLEESVLAPAPEVPLEILHTDESVIVVNKAAGIVVHPGNGVRDATLVQGLLARFPELYGVGEAHRPGIVHRLDRGTSGLLVVARTEQAYHSLVEQLSGHEVQRRYLALVIGHPDATNGLIDAPIGRSRHDPTRRAVVADGRPARTRYRLLQQIDEPEALSLVACELETGRTHQIRVHLQAIGLPVVADPNYGGARLRFGLRRPFLHAAQLEFAHPGTGEQVRFEAPLPDDLRAVLRGLGVDTPPTVTPS